MDKIDALDQRQTRMETGQIAGVYAEVSGFPTPVSAHVKVEELPEYRVYSVTAGELTEPTASIPACPTARG